MSRSQYSKSQLHSGKYSRKELHKETVMRYAKYAYTAKKSIHLGRNASVVLPE